MFGGKGRQHRTYSAPLIDRLNTRCQKLFGETVEENFRAPADIHSNELLGLEYLFSQSTGESLSLQDIINDGPGPEEEVVQPGQPDPDPEADEAYQSDGESRDDVLCAIQPHIKLTSDETSTVHPPAFVSNSVCLNQIQCAGFWTMYTAELTIFVWHFYDRRMPAVKTLFLASRGWKSFALSWWRLA